MIDDLVNKHMPTNHMPPQAPLPAGILKQKIYLLHLENDDPVTI